MKKLLSILGAMTLIGTATTNVVACGGEKPTPPTPDTRTDIENKINSPIALGQLSANTKVDFLAKLQTELARIPNLNTITPSDYDVYKAGTTTTIQDSDITAGNSLNIKIVAKGNKFKGNKDSIVVNYNKADTRTDIENKINSPIALGQLSANTKVDFLAKLQTALERIPNLNTITPSDYDVYKAGTTTTIQDSDITAGNSLNIKIVAKGNKFKGNKDSIVVNYNKADTRTDIENKINSPIALGQLSANTKVDFLAKLQTELARIPNLNTITPSDYDVYKAGTTTTIQDSDITAGNSLNIKIVAKGNKFKGNKDSIVVNYNKADTRTDIENKINSPIALGQLSANTKVDFLAKLQTELARIPNLNTITPSDYDVYKAGTTTTIQDSDITAGNSLNIKIVAKGNKFKGNKDSIVVNYNKADTRTDISTITQLTGLDITADIQKTYNDLWTEILKANEFKNLTYNLYKTFMYKTNDLKDTTDIKILKQQKGDIYIILQVEKNEGINCFGDTPRLKITLK